MTEPEKVSSASSLVLNGRRILVVESDPNYAFLWTTLLEEAGASVIQARESKPCTCGTRTGAARPDYQQHLSGR